jgi:hypothetical protein
MEKAEKVGLLHNLGHHRKARVSSQLIFSHLQGKNMSYRFKLTKELGAGDKVTHSHSVAWLVL